jgi:carbamoyltransferase
MIDGQYVVLSIYEVHMASAAIIIDGQVVAASHEERFSRIKNDIGFPLKAALFCMEYAGVNPSQVDAVVLVNEFFDANGVANILFKRMALYSKDDWITENERYWGPKLIEKKKEPQGYFFVMGGWDRVDDNHYYDLKTLNMNDNSDVISKKFNLLRLEVVERELNIPRSKIHFAPHYLCHHYHAYYSGPLRGKDVVVVHAEGDGGKYNQAVSVPTEAGLKILYGTNQFNIGRLYQWMTLYLGMKPYAHEYKLMGLAPYANEYETKKSREVFDRVFRVDHENLVINYNETPQDLYFTFRDKLQGHRFDGIAGALQEVVEECLSEWVRAVVKKTGCPRVAYGGGVAMNVKANMRISQLDEIEEFFVPLAPSDESNIFGAAYWLTEKHFLRNDRNPENIPPIKHAYWGRDFSEADISTALAEQDMSSYSIEDGADQHRIADLLAHGDVVARSQGRSEFGQRALGNRSILANPCLKGTVEKINHQIKYRDFWMPFAPSILDTHVDIYLKNDKRMYCPFMTMSFPSRESENEKIFQALHPSDTTARPQMVTRETNAEFYDLIKAFCSRTGTGSLLNTSFNIHGEPIVDSPKDALHVFLNSDLDALWLGETLIRR